MESPNSIALGLAEDKLDSAMIGLAEQPDLEIFEVGS
jgi:hypothetical protein